MLSTYTRNHRLMFAAMFLWGFGMGMFIFIQPLFIESLGATTSQVGFALAVGGLLVTAVYIPVGLWADRRGRRITILAGWWLASLATILMALAPDWRWLIPALVMYQLANFAMPAFNGYVAAESAGRNLFSLMNATLAKELRTHRRLRGTLFNFYWLDEPFGTYLQVTNSSPSMSDVKPTFTNIVNGYGLFASRRQLPNPSTDTTLSPYPFRSPFWRQALGGTGTDSLRFKYPDLNFQP